MSPASLRRYRAERLLREEFRSLRARVLANARGSLRACGVRLDDSDLEACYAQAWQGLYAVMLEGQRIGNPAGWLAVATFRRAIDEHRARAHVGLRGQLEPEQRHDSDGSMQIPDPAAELDRRLELRRVFEALRLRMSAREQQAAALCYLQGLTRAEASRAMGVSEARMRKLMEGRGSGSPGVAGKMAALLQTIRDGGWCEEQASLMRGFAYGVLDPHGERYSLALAHASACPACRAYVASLRGLAALLPPTPALLELVLAGAGSSKAAGIGAALGQGAGASASGAMPSAAVSGAAGAGAAGGGWLLAGGGVGAKLAAGCLLALGVGAGCAVLGEGRGAGEHRSAHVRRHWSPRIARAGASSAEASRASSSAPGASSASSALTAGAASTRPAARASREFGPEQGGALAGGERASPPRAAPSARLARAGAEFALGAARGSSSQASAGAAPARPSRPYAAQREFSPG